MQTNLYLGQTMNLKSTSTRLDEVSTQGFDYTAEKVNQAVNLNYLEYEMSLAHSDVQSTIPK